MGFDWFNNARTTRDNPPPFLIGRVSKVILGPLLPNGEVDPDYKAPTDIGKIFFVLENSYYSKISRAIDRGSLAKPVWTGIKQIPVENEFVYIIPGPSLEMLNNIGDPDTGESPADIEPSYYYLPPFGLWDSLNHNAFPTLGDYADYINESVTLQRALEGTPGTQITNSFDYPLGNNFIERLNVRSLRQFTGDLSIESRWGSSIRFGSSLASNVSENNWSISSNDGDPIVMIRNGQPTTIPGDTWDPIVEDINTDPSSIYLTAGQRIVITDISNNFTLKSLGVTFKPEVTIVKTITPVPNSNDNLSPTLVDNLTKLNGPNNV